jgi:ATP-dependent protease ClpP protease subunit
LKKSSRSHDPISDLDNIFTPRPKFYQHPVATAVTFYLCGEIKPAEDYVDWFQILRAAGESDIIYIRINSEGGDLFSALQLVRAIQDSQATIVCSVEGICMSAATLIFLSGDRFELSDHTMFMFHNYSSGTIGKGGEMYDQITHFRAWSEKLFNSFYGGFLTKEEIKSMLDNKDIWLDANEVAKRLGKRLTAEPEKETVETKPKRTKKITTNNK